MACLVAAAPLCISRQRTSYASMDCEDDVAKADSFFDMICKYQSQRLDEQRAVLPSCPPHPLRLAPPTSTAASSAPCKKSPEDDQLLEMLFRLQHSRLNEQRCEMPSAPHLLSQSTRCGPQQEQHDGDDESDEVSSSEEEEEEEGRRDQLGELQSPPPQNQALPPPPLPAAGGVAGRRRSTMPSEDFFNLIQHLQSTRIEDQRSPLPVLAN